MEPDEPTPKQLIYEPSRWQALYHSLKHKEALGAGAVGPGKSVCLQYDPLEQILVEHERCADKNHPNHVEWGASKGAAWYFRRSTPMLEDAIRNSRAAFQLIDPGAKFNAKSNTWTFSSGYIYQYNHCTELGSWINYFSRQCTHLAFDELNQFDEDQYNKIGLRCRSSDLVLRPMLKIRSMSNPGSSTEGGAVSDPQWVRKRFVDPAPSGGVTLQKILTRQDGTTDVWDWIYLPATLYDNPNPDFVREVELRLLAMPEQIRKAYLEGNWYSVVGAFFDEVWDHRKHVCGPFAVPREWRHFRSMDWGFRSNGCIQWWAVTPDDEMVCHRELMFRGKDAQEVACEVIEFETAVGLAKNGRSLITGPADTQLWEERGDVGVSKAEDFYRAGVPWDRANKRSRQRNSERLTLRLRGRGFERQRGIVFFDNCRDIISNLPQIMPDEHNRNEPDTRYRDDHSLDALLYAVEYADRPQRVGESREEKWYSGLLDKVTDRSIFERNKKAGRNKVYSYEGK